MSARPWIPVPFGSLPDIASGTLIEVMWSNGSTAIYRYCVDKTATATNGKVARVRKTSELTNPPIAYRLRDNGQAEAECRAERMERFRKIADSGKWDIAPIKAPQKERI